MASNDLQCVIALFVEEKSPQDVIKAILKDDLPENQQYDGTSVYFTWKISNKYFDADVKLCCCQSSDSSKLAIMRSLEAVVFVVDMTKPSTFTEVEKMSSLFSNGSDPEVRLLWDCSQCKLQDDLQNDVFSWCIEHQFEFVENEEVGDEEDVDEGFCTKYGVDRIVEALSSHVWRNHQTKEQTGAAKSEEEGDERLFQNGESFEELFGKLHLMKEEANSLEGDARKDYAEKVAYAFMEALGIDESENEEEEG